MTAKRRLEIHHGIEPLMPEWDELAADVAADPFMRPGWFQAWHRSFNGGPLEIHCLRRDGGQLLALAPFVRGRRSLISPTNWHTPSYEVIATDADAAGSLLRKSIDKMPARLRIRFAAADGITARGLAEVAEASGVKVFERRLARSPVIELDGDFETYRRTLSKNLRKNLNRRRSRMEEQGKVEITVITDSNDAEQGLDRAFAIEASGWKGRHRTAMASKPETRRFYVELVRWAAEAGILRLVFLKVGGEPIAFDLGLQSHGWYYSLKTGYEARHQRLGPGAALTYELIRRCYDEGLERIELLGAEDEFKRRWAGDSGVDMIEIQAFKGPLAPLDRAIQVQGRELARRLLTKARSRTGG